MELEEALLRRRSVRQYLDTPITDEEIEALMKAAMSAPSGKNLRPWRFVVVTNPKKVQALRDASPYGNYNAPCAILVIGDKAKSPMWFNDCGAATENILLKAVDLGLGTVWCAQYPMEERERASRKIIGLDNPDEIIYALLYLGHPAVAPEPRTQYEPEKVEIQK